MKKDRGGRGRSNFAAQQQTFKPAAGRRYLAFYKPFEVLCQFSPEKLPDGTFSEKVTLAAFGLPPDVYPVGRLDFDSEGLLLLSDDGRLTTRLFGDEHRRTYLAQVENIPSQEKLERLEAGVVIEGRRTKPCETWLLQKEPVLPERSKPIRFRKDIPTAWIELTLFEGRNRQVRKMTAQIGHPTLRLLRVAIGRLGLFDLGLKPGEWLDLSPEEVAAVFLD
ncbi:MAG: pseudouridine synthase [Cyanobacteria bacterium SZAS TMP-1]|nr:pseudouridine synthase [Cyanobacteria bacterium SZAS TMP-1]